MPLGEDDEADARVNWEDRHRLTATGGLAALSLNALSSVAYGPEAMVLALIARGLTAALLVVDYVLAVAISLVAGAASLAGTFPILAHYLLAVCLIGLALVTMVNLFGIAESARVLMVPTVVLILAILAMITLGLRCSRPVAVTGTSLGPPQLTESLRLLLEVMLIGLALVIHLHHVLPRGGPIEES